jgi:RNA polymerase sigma-70 factor (ECF subfamily)
MKNRADSLPDTDLIAAFVERGEEAAFRALYRRHGSRLASLVLRLTGGDTHLADDLLQETWLSACRGLAGFRREAAFSTWLTSIALNTVRRHFSRNAARWTTPLEEPALPPVAPPDSAVRIDLERAVAQLPSGYRIVLMLHDVEGLRHHEIAAALGMSEGTSKSQLFRARQRMRQLLDPPREDCHATG